MMIDQKQKKRKKEREERKGNGSECMDAWKGFNFFFYS